MEERNFVLQKPTLLRDENNDGAGTGRVKSHLRERFCGAKSQTWSVSMSLENAFWVVNRPKKGIAK
jgi:hypothetical protein